MATDQTIETLALYHQLDTLARQVIEALDKKLEEADSDTVQCRVDSLETIRELIDFQRSSLSELVEQSLSVNDQIETLLNRLSVRHD
jgi:hypothetical protein